MVIISRSQSLSARWRARCFSCFSSPGERDQRSRLKSSDRRLTNGIWNWFSFLANGVLIPSSGVFRRYELRDWTRCPSKDDPKILILIPPWKNWYPSLASSRWYSLIGEIDGIWNENDSIICVPGQGRSPETRTWGHLWIVSATLFIGKRRSRRSFFIRFHCHRILYSLPQLCYFLWLESQLTRRRKHGTKEKIGSGSGYNIDRMRQDKWNESGGIGSTELFSRIRNLFNSDFACFWEWLFPCWSGLGPGKAFEKTRSFESSDRPYVPLRAGQLC